MKKLIATGAVLALLAGCSGDSDPIPTPSAEKTATETEAPEVGQSERAEQVLSSLSERIDEVRTSKSLENADDRLTGPAKVALQAELVLADKISDDVVLSHISTEGANSTWGASDSFPKVAMAFTEDPDHPAQLLTLVQVNGQMNYRLWGFAELFASEKPLSFKMDSETVNEKSAEGLIASPTEVGDEYAKFLNGEESSLTFAKDPFATSLMERRDMLTESIGETGNVSVPVERLNHGPLSVRTEDGGVVSMASYQYKIDIERTTPGSTITVGEAIAVWMTGDPQENRYNVKGKLTATYNVMVAFHIPTEGDPVVIAASRPDLMNVTDDEGANPGA